ncbi:uncharacterized protein BDV14DRAFT_179177 [Aspergillus stella-maris]|uniref:uncharacterized protein n=1 Tax=Aspergillus stella-maris TaxID=1810926 RepID=UPI003CCD787C
MVKSWRAIEHPGPELYIGKLIHQHRILRPRRVLLKPLLGGMHNSPLNDMCLTVTKN